MCVYVVSIQSIDELIHGPRPPARPSSFAHQADPDLPQLLPPRRNRQRRRRRPCCNARYHLPSSLRCHVPVQRRAPLGPVLALYVRSIMVGPGIDFRHTHTHPHLTQLTYR